MGMPHKYYWRRKSGGGDKKSSLFGKASIADGIPPAAENGRTRAPFWFAGKRLASFAPAIPQLTVFANWGQNKKRRKILVSKIEKSLDNAYIQGGVTGVKEDFYKIIHQLSCK